MLYANMDRTHIDTVMERTEMANLVYIDKIESTTRGGRKKDIFEMDDSAAFYCVLHKHNNLDLKVE